MNTFSYYDHVLDTAVLLGALPARVAAIADDLDRYFAAARGNDDVAPLEMTKWFDTNYHYLVPEIGTDTRFALNPAKLLAELEEARAQGIPARPVIVGPVTFLALSKAVGGADAPIERLDELVGVYAELLELLSSNGVDWVQLDEPVLVTDILSNAAELAERTYARLGALETRPALFVATYFGELTDALPALARTPVEAIGIDLVTGSVAAVAAVPELTNKIVVAGVVDGRNVWRTDLEAALGTLATLLGSAGSGCGVRRRARRCTCRTRWRRRPTSTTPCAAGLRSAPRRWRRSSPCPAVCGTGAMPWPPRSPRRTRRSRPAGRTRGCPTTGSAPASRRSPRRAPRVALPKTVAPRRTNGCGCPRCRPRPSGRTRRRRRSGSRARRCGPARSTTPSTGGG